MTRIIIHYIIHNYNSIIEIKKYLESYHDRKYKKKII